MNCYTARNSFKEQKMKSYEVVFTCESGNTVQCLVQAYNRYRALGAAMFATAIKGFNNVTITPAASVQ